MMSALRAASERREHHHGVCVFMFKMSVRRIGALIALALLGFGSAPVAATPDLGFDLRYAMHWGGVHVADVTLAYDPEPGSYTSGFQIEAVGLAKLFTRYKGRAAISGLRNGGVELEPENYQYGYTTRKSTRQADVTFDPQTNSAVEVVSLKRGKPDSVDVPRELWVGVIDPLTAFLNIRTQLAAVQQGRFEPVRAQIFDGRRRYDVEVVPVAREQARLNGARVPALRVEMTLDPIAGFSDDDFVTKKPGEDAVRMEALLTDDERLIPLQVRTLNAPVALIFNLQKDCSGANGCRGAVASAS